MLDIFTVKSDTIIVIVIILLLGFLLYNHRKSGLSSNNDDTRLGVKELIEKVRGELIELDRKRIEANEAHLFELKDFELEVNFVVKESNTQKGAFDFKVVTVGGEAGFSSEQTQKIVLRMTAIKEMELQAEPTNEGGKISETPPGDKKE